MFEYLYLLPLSLETTIKLSAQTSRIVDSQLSAVSQVAHNLLFLKLEIVN